MEGPRQTYQRLRGISEGPGSTDSERETARLIMARYIAKYGDEVSIPETEAEVESTVKTDGGNDLTLAVHCGVFMGLKVYDLGRTKYRGTKREKFVADGRNVLYRGPKSAVDAALGLYEHHREKHESLLKYTSNGYRYGAMPLPSSATVSGDPPPPDLVDVIRSAMQAGKSNAMNRALPTGEKPDAT